MVLVLTVGAYDGIIAICFVAVIYGLAVIDFRSRTSAKFLLTKSFPIDYFAHPILI